MRRLTWGIIALVLFLAMSGCVTEKDATPSENEKILSAGADDIDGNSIADVKSYVFRPLSLDADQNIVIQKSLVAAQSGTLFTMKTSRLLTEVDVSRLESYIYQYDNSLKEYEAECNDALGLSTRSCTNAKDCAEVCSSGECQKFAYASSTMGFWVADYVNKTAQLRSEVSDVRNAIIYIKDSSSKEKETIMRKLSRILDTTIAINGNPLLSDNAFGLCQPIRYSNKIITDMMALLGQYERVPSEYTYAVSIKFLINTKDYTEVKLADTLPQAMRIQLRSTSMPDGVSYDADKNTLAWQPVSFSVYPEYIFGYSYVSGQGMREDIFTNWPAPRIGLRTISLSKSPTMTSIFDTSKEIYAAAKVVGYYPALAIVLAVWDAVFFLALTLGKAAYAIVGATRSKSGITDAMIRSFGNANPHTREYIIACGLFVFIGYGLTFLSATVAEDTLNADNLIKNLVENPVGAFSLIFIFLGLHAAYSLFEDRVKGVFAGKMYYENIMDLSAKANGLRFKKLQEKMNALSSKVNAAAQLNVSEEKGVLISVPEARIEELLKKEGSEKAVKELIEAYEAKIDSALTTASEKVNIASLHWPEWKKEIAGKLTEYDNITLDSLSSIPLEWRLWAVNKYISENPGEGIALEGDKVKTASTTPEGRAENILKKMVMDGIAIGGAVFKKEGVLSVFSRVGNRALVAALAWRTLNYGMLISQKAMNAGCKRMVIVGARNAAIFIIGPSGVDGVIFAPKDRAQEAYVEFDSRMKRLG